MLIWKAGKREKSKQIKMRIDLINSIRNVNAAGEYEKKSKNYMVRQRQETNKDQKKDMVQNPNRSAR